MLTDSVKKNIQDTFKNLKTTLPLFIPRKAQNYLIAEFGKTLAGEYSEPRIFVTEAGTGIGKSLSYLVSAIPYALEENCKLVISTATVALQEQLIEKDLPLVHQASPQHFSFILVKGRQRYICAEKLLAIASHSNGNESQFSLLETKPTDDDVAQIQRLSEAYINQKWDGDRDNWHEVIPNHLWHEIASDRHVCNTRSHLHRECPFAKARRHIHQANIIVVNHSLLMADLELGGGVILSEPEKTIYVIDEAHHFPLVARDSLAASATVLGARDWLNALKKNLSKWVSLAGPKEAERSSEVLKTQIGELRQILKQTHFLLSQLPIHPKEKTYRFTHGQLPDELTEQSKAIEKLAKNCRLFLGKIQALINEKVEEGTVQSGSAIQALKDCGFFIQRLENLMKVWALMAAEQPQDTAPFARWIVQNASKTHPDDFSAHASPIEIGHQLKDILWERAAGVGLFSATLRALNSFDYFCHQAGLDSQTGGRYLALASPFDYPNQARLVIPKIPVEPSHNDFTSLLPDLIMAYLEGETASLVLFSSYWQMKEVAEQIKERVESNGWLLQIQGQQSRSSQLEKHRQACKQGKVSILFGTGSFSEGLDLPGNELTNLIITKIPFAVPTSPIEAALSEFIESSNGNPFLQISVPEASKKLIQAVGRLIRKESDSGRVVLLDKRVLTKNYGQLLLDSLPPFQRVIE